ncbi:hypothetical protein NLJ89_g12059 [Agrocybe chaxingu]|uniref:Uncharacterized protein n=1 Tax=Agrocybe chaxingu TaxID=84603 RepID=A0A9W8JNU3_9AGAR|nr:hypothetical protein NLJ89_g12059 [Agrocybe chaxingu]
MITYLARGDVCLLPSMQRSAMGSRFRGPSRGRPSSEPIRTARARRRAQNHPFVPPSTRLRARNTRPRRVGMCAASEYSPTLTLALVKTTPKTMQLKTSFKDANVENDEERHHEEGHHDDESRSTQQSRSTTDWMPTRSWVSFSIVRRLDSCPIPLLPTTSSASRL